MVGRYKKASFQMGFRRGRGFKYITPVAKKRTLGKPEPGREREREREREQKE
jgi:hypothetical protein